MMVISELHKILLFHRKQAGLTRNEMAELAGVGKTVIFDLEKGKNTVKLSTVLKVLEAMNIDINLQSPLMEEYEKSDNKDP